MDLVSFEFSSLPFPFLFSPYHIIFPIRKFHFHFEMNPSFHSLAKYLNNSKLVPHPRRELQR